MEEAWPSLALHPPVNCPAIALAGAEEAGTAMADALLRGVDINRGPAEAHGDWESENEHLHLCDQNGRSWNYI